MNAKQYRSHLYQVRNHPRTKALPDFYDQRDSFVGLYLSLIPFLGLEYFFEKSVDVPSGLIFPTGFLLFWAFYYTYYKPGILEDKLTQPHKWDLTAIPTVLIGVAIWFLKVTVVELTHLLVRKPEPVKPKDRRQQTRSQWTKAHSTQSMPPRPPPPSLLPKDILHSLTLLGLKEGASWELIHHRYRELAKQYHPDLNHDITDVGRRFMMYDAAYRKLASAKAQYFTRK